MAVYGLSDSLKPLSAAEEQVLLAVWSCKPPASRRDIGERLAEKDGNRPRCSIFSTDWKRRAG